MTYQYAPSAKRFAGLIAVLGLLVLLTRIYLRMEIPETLGQAISYLSQFFTILTNFLTVFLMGLTAIGVGLHPRIMTAIVIAITCVGLVYHAVLAHLLDLSGLALWADHGVHTVIPALALIWWLLYAPRPRLGLIDMGNWIVWPLAYCVYILIRASVSGFYPYPFLNLPDIGTAALIMNIGILLVVFVVVGIILTGLKAVVSKFAQ